VCVRRIVVVGSSILLATVLLAGCLFPNGNPVQVNATLIPGYLYDAPDPAAVGIGSTGMAQLYSTGTQNGPNGFYNIQTETCTTGTNNCPNGTSDALPTIPSYLVLDNEWAPSVIYLGGQYVMWFSGENTNGNPNCLEAATSAQPGGPFQVVSGPWCDNNTPQGGLLDPEISIDPYYGTVWLFYSRQWGANGNSEIDETQLTGDGTALLNPNGPRYDVVNYSATAGLSATSVDGTSYSNGTSSFIEGPSMVLDPEPSTINGTNYPYDLFVSLGTWNQTDSYHTIEMLCVSRWQCNPETAGLDVSGNLLGSNNAQGLYNPGGLSIDQTSVAGTTWSVFAAACTASSYCTPKKPRGTFWEGTIPYCSGSCNTAAAVPSTSSRPATAPTPVATAAAVKTP
jgi:hypothetical protein